MVVVVVVVTGAKYPVVHTGEGPLEARHTASVPTDTGTNGGLVPLIQRNGLPGDQDRPARKSGMKYSMPPSLRVTMRMGLG